MELEQLCRKLESILERRVEAADGRTESERHPGREIVSAAGVRLAVHGTLTPAEKKLVAWVLEAELSGGRTKGGGDEDERMALLLSSWIIERVERGDHDADLPEALARWPMLRGVKVPLLVYGDSPHREQASYKELKKLMKSFFDADVVLVPLHSRQWLILADVSLLSPEDRDGEDESLEDAISALASGLQDMAANEWVGECHVAATYPFSPTTSLIPTVITLRESIELGRSYRVSSFIHLPWELRLETLLDAVPNRVKTRFLEGVLRRAESFDPEMLQTLEAFFAENCNVSDTAKRLYIHRNTLLYRLDKFKQETGMDVRDFDDAVLVRLAILLYKVTKRK